MGNAQDLSKTPKITKRRNEANHKRIVHRNLWNDKSVD